MIVYAFNAAKDLLCHSPILSAPNFALAFKLQVDASLAGAGAVLLQEDSTGIEHPVSYFSKKFTKCQQRYSMIEKEALALQHFEVYLGGSCNPVVVYTDHNPLVFLGRMCNSNQHLMRLLWRPIWLDHHSPHLTDLPPKLMHARTFKQRKRAPQPCIYKVPGVSSPTYSIKVEKTSNPKSIFKKEYLLIHTFFGDKRKTYLRRGNQDKIITKICQLTTA